MEQSNILPLVGLGVLLAGGLGYYLAIAVVRISRTIDEALVEVGEDDE